MDAVFKTVDEAKEAIADTILADFILIAEKYGCHFLCIQSVTKEITEERVSDFEKCIYKIKQMCLNERRECMDLCLPSYPDVYEDELCLLIEVERNLIDLCIDFRKNIQEDISQIVQLISNGFKQYKEILLHQGELLLDPMPKHNEGGHESADSESFDEEIFIDAVSNDYPHSAERMWAEVKLAAREKMAENADIAETDVNKAVRNYVLRMIDECNTTNNSDENEDQRNSCIRDFIQTYISLTELDKKWDRERDVIEQRIAEEKMAFDKRMAGYKEEIVSLEQNPPSAKQ